MGRITRASTTRSLAGGFFKAPQARDWRPLIAIHWADLEKMKANITAAGGKIMKSVFRFSGGRRFHLSNGNELAGGPDI
jgi:predicted enzyme related to lactoylglutathione lyase